MKNIILYITFIFICLFTLYSCNDDFLEKIPEDSITKEGFFNSDTDFRTYSLGFYNFYGYGVGNTSNIPVNSDEVVEGNQTQSSLIFDRRTVPASGGGWSWSNIRAVNIMIEAAQNADLDNEVKNHWEGVARLFRALDYFGKVKLYGDVPWIDHELGTTSEELYAVQDPRSVVMGHVLEDLNFAVQNIRVDDGVNLINKYVALAIKSEICLFEGTFRKYHTEINLSDASLWLNECVSASEAIINSGKYDLSPDFRAIYSSLNLAGSQEAILFKQYEAGVIVNTQARMLGISNRKAVTRDAMESFLCSDGLPFGVSPLHPKAQVGTPEFPNEEFQNRDPRMGKTLVIPFAEGATPQNDPIIFETTTAVEPLFSPSFLGEPGLVTTTGYGLYKWWNPNTPVNDVNGTTDAPLYTYKTILLNYVEAKAELGAADDVVLNNSINKLRGRIGMPNLTVAIANSINDPKKAMYAPEISNLLWEIRRERRVELMAEGSRFDDIIRWKKASYFGKPFIGAYVDLDNRPPSAYFPNGTNITTVSLGDINGNPLPGARVGYALPYIERQPSWTDNDIKLYYTPIDTKTLTINTKLKQVPGWE